MNEVYKIGLKLEKIYYLIPFETKMPSVDTKDETGWILTPAYKFNYETKKAFPEPKKLAVWLKFNPYLELPDEMESTYRFKKKGTKFIEILG